MFLALSEYSLWTFGVLLAGILVGLLVAARYARESRVSQFYFIREQAKVKAGRVMIVVGLLVVITIALGILVTVSSTFTRVAQASPTPTPTPTLSPTMPATAVVATASPTSVLTPTTPMPTATASPGSTIIPTIGTPSSALTPIVGVETPSPDATFGEITLARGVTDDNEPQDPGTVFPADVPQLYAFFDYQNLSDGVLWTQAWYRKGEEIGSESGLWEWGSYGTAWIFLKPVGGYPRGEYEVRLYIGDELKQTATFTVR